MKKKLLAIISLICAFVCTVSLAACGNKPSGPVTTGTLNKDESGNVIFSNVSIKLSTIVSGDDEAPFRQIVQQFNNEYRGRINVEITNIAQDNFDDTVQQQIAQNNNPPDLIMSHQKSHMAFANNNLIQPFDSIMEESGIKIDMKDYATELAQYSSLGRENELYSIPCDAQSSVVLYNKQLLSKYSLELPTNNAELISVCTTVANGEKITPIAWSTSHDAFRNYIFTTAVLQNGGKLYKNDFYADWQSDAANLTAVKNGIASIRGLINHSPKLAQYNQSLADSLNAFLTNKALFYVTTPWTLKNVLSAYQKQNSIESLAVTKSDYIGGTSIANWFALDGNSTNGNKIYGDSHFFAMSMTVQDINKKAAICEFVKWITQNVDIGTEWAEAGHISMSKIVDASNDYLQNDLVKNYLKKFYPDINSFVCMGNTPYAKQLQMRFGQIIVDALGNASDANDASIIKTAQDNFNADVDFEKM